jgi:hypothetical protein
MAMSLTVSPTLIEQAQRGEVSDAAFIDCIRESLPYAWQMVSGLVDELRATGAQAVNNKVPPPDDASWGQMFRMMASDSMRGALERHFGVRLAFQNCCKVGVFQENATGAYNEFISPAAQILNQRPEWINC